MLEDVGCNGAESCVWSISRTFGEGLECLTLEVDAWMLRKDLFDRG